MRYAAFLRGVNLGKRTVKSAELKAAFEAMGFTDVKTLLASGNVLFDAKTGKELKARIEAGLKETFGFDVPIVLRSLDELTAMVKADPFGREAGEDAQLHVLLLDQDLPKGFKQAGPETTTWRARPVAKSTTSSIARRMGRILDARSSRSAMAFQRGPL